MASVASLNGNIVNSTKQFTIPEDVLNRLPRGEARKIMGLGSQEAVDQAVKDVLSELRVNDIFTNLTRNMNYTRRQRNNRFRFLNPNQCFKFDGLSPLEKKKLLKKVIEKFGLNVIPYLQFYGAFDTENDFDKELLDQLIQLISNEDKRKIEVYAQIEGLPRCIVYALAKKLVNEISFYNDLYEMITNYSSLSNDEKFELTKLVAAKKGISSDINMYGEFNPSQMFELAKITAKVEDISSKIASFGEFSQAQQFELAKIIVEHTKYPSLFKIQNFPDLIPDQCFEIANILTDKNPLAVINKVGLYNLKPDQQFHIANVIHYRKPQSILFYINNFDQIPLQKKYQLIKACALKSPIEFCKNTSLIDSLSLNHKLDIAHTLAKKYGTVVTSYLNNFGEISLEERLSIVKDAAGSENPGACHVINKYEFTPQQEFEIALIEARQKNGRVSEHLNKFQALTPDQKFQIAMAEVEFHTSSLSFYLGYYEGLSPDQWYELSLKVAKQDGHSFSKHADKYLKYATDPQKFTLAKIAAKSSGGGVTEHLEYYGALTQEQQFEICKNCL